MWFMIKRPLVKNDIICGAVYVSPEGSKVHVIVNLIVLIF